MKQQSCNCRVVFSMFGLDGGLAGGHRSALLIRMLIGMSCYLTLLCQTGGSASDRAYSGHLFVGGK